MEPLFFRHAWKSLSFNKFHQNHIIDVINHFVKRQEVFAYVKKKATTTNLIWMEKLSKHIIVYVYQSSYQRIVRGYPINMSLNNLWRRYRGKDLFKHKTNIISCLMRYCQQLFYRRYPISNYCI